MLEFITHNGIKYPKFQSEGFAAQFAIPFALNILNGDGIDIGCNRQEWAYPKAKGLVDLMIDENYSAEKLPTNPADNYGQWDYLFSSHLLEHLVNWVGYLQYWHERLKPGGILFLYLPCSNNQTYWRPWHNRKHVNYFTPEIFKQYFTDLPNMWDQFYVSGIDANCSFIAYASKA